MSSLLGAPATRLSALAALLSALAALLLALCAPGCVPELGLEGAGCPCAAGYHCCPLEARCLPDGEICPLSRNCPLPPTAANVLVVGTTDIALPAPNFVPLDESGRAPLLRGPQGGYHVNLQVQLLGLDPSSVTLTRALFDPADPDRSQMHALRWQTDQPALFCDGDRYFLLLDSQRTYVCPSLRAGQAMAERDLVLRVEARDHDGRTVSGERTLHPRCPDGDLICVSDNAVGCAAR